MELYDVKGRGFAGPLNSQEISQLFRSGTFGPSLPCKPRGEATWRTIDELFPLLKLKAAAPPLRFGDPAPPHHRLRSIAKGALLLAIIGITSFHIWVQSAPTTFGRFDERTQPQTTERTIAQTAKPARITSFHPSGTLLEQGVVVAEQTRLR